MLFLSEIVPETSYDRISADYESIVIRNKNLGLGFELLELTGWRSPLPASSLHWLVASSATSPTTLPSACRSARTRRNTLWGGECCSRPASSRKRKDMCHSRVHTISNLERRYAFNLYLTILLLRCSGLQYNGSCRVFNERMSLFFTKTPIKFAE